MTSFKKWKEVLCKRARDTMKYSPRKNRMIVKFIYFFIARDTSCGKSQLVKSIQQFRIRELDDKIEKLFRSQLINEKDALYPTDALYKFTENVPDKSHTERKLKRLSDTDIH